MTETNKKKSVVIYDSWGELFSGLPDEKAGKLIKAIADYSFKGKKDIDDPVVEAMFGMIRMKLDEDAAAYEEVIRQRSEAGKKAMSKRWGNNKSVTNHNTVITNDNKPITNDNEDITNITVYDSVSEYVSDKDIKEKEHKNKFVKPSLEDVKAYCQERNNGVNPEAFIDFYESKGWKVGNQPMKDWKAAIRTWEKRDDKNKSSPSHPEGTSPQTYGKIHNYFERDVDYSALQKEFLGNV